MGTWNERNGAILGLLASREMTVEEVAAELGCCRSNAATAMLKMYRFGQLGRKPVVEGTVTLSGKGKSAVTRPRSVFRYWTTDKGGERLARINGS